MRRLGLGAARGAEPPPSSAARDPYHDRGQPRPTGPVPWWRREVALDVLVALVAVAFSAAMTLWPAPTIRPHGGATFAVLAAAALLLLLRRRAPLTVAWTLTAVTAAWIVVDLVDPGTLVRAGRDGTWIPPATIFAAYSVMVFARDRRAAWLPVAVLAVLGGLPRTGQPWPATAIPGVAVVLGPAVLGMYSAARRRLLRMTMERAERAEQERHLLAEQARADERARLAAEMHDVVTHRVSLMVLRAGALAVSSRDDATRTAADDLRVAGCQALEELQDLVGLLRDPAAGDLAEPSAVPRAPVPDLTPLVAESESVGVPVELVEEGSPTLTSPVVGRTAYRIVQEALTNVRKHAPGSRVRVQVSYRPDGVQLMVENTEPAGAADPALAAAGSGTGLAGLRQRVELVGGTLCAGSHRGGFRLDATLPAYVPTSSTTTGSPLEPTS